MRAGSRRPSSTRARGAVFSGEFATSSDATLVEKPTAAEAPPTPAQGPAAAESYGPPLVDGERWPRPAPRGVSERVAAPVMSVLAYVALVAGLLLASPIGAPIETPEFIEIPVEVVALPPEGEAAAAPAEPAATPAEPATADAVPELHLPAPPEVADPDIRSESAPAAVAALGVPPPPEVDALAIAAEPYPALETAQVATPLPPPDPIEPAPPMRDEIRTEAGPGATAAVGGLAASGSAAESAAEASSRRAAPSQSEPSRAAGGRARGAPRGSGSSPQSRRAATRCGGS